MKIKHSEKEIKVVIKLSLETGNYVLLPHARQRCKERKVLPRDIEFALKNGKRIKARDRFDDSYESWSYTFQGKTIDERDLRIVIIIDDKLKVVTVVVLDEE